MIVEETDKQDIRPSLYIVYAREVLVMQLNALAGKAIQVLDYQGFLRLVRNRDKLDDTHG